MLEGKRVAVVVPAYDEERLVGETLRGIPDFVDRIYVVDDASRDGTGGAGARRSATRASRSSGTSGTRASAPRSSTGYRRALEEEIDVTCVMAADNQMDPAELAGLVAPVARGEVEYAKANRLVSGEAWKVIPRTRYLGNAVLSLLTKIASGLLARRRLAGRVHGDLAATRCGGSTSTGSTRATASRTTCSST